MLTVKLASVCAEALTTRLFLGTLGTFSSVFKAEDRYHDLYDNFIWTHTLPHPPWDNDGQPRPRKRVYVALKRIYVTSSPERIYNELEVMEELR
jgi:cell division control protein 7